MGKDNTTSGAHENPRSRSGKYPPRALITSHPPIGVPIERGVSPFSGQASVTL